MSITHTVQQGECLSTIAEKYGFFWQTLWDFDENADLREKRGSPSILMPGDLVAIPDSAPTEYRLQTGKTHRFVAKINQPTFRVRFQFGGKAITAESYNFYIGDSTEPTSGTTSDSGEISQVIPLDTATVTVEFPERKIRRRFALGHLDPIDTPTGQQARLRQLGFYQGKIDGQIGPLTIAAVTGFQEAMGLDVNAAFDGDTLDALRSEYGS